MRDARRIQATGRRWTSARPRQSSIKTRQSTTSRGVRPWPSFPTNQRCRRSPSWTRLSRRCRVQSSASRPTAARRSFPTRFGNGCETSGSNSAQSGRDHHISTARSNGVRRSHSWISGRPRASMIKSWMTVSPNGSTSSTWNDRLRVSTARGKRSLRGTHPNDVPQRLRLDIRSVGDGPRAD